MSLRVRWRRSRLGPRLPRVVIPNGEVFTKAVIVNTAYGKRRSEHIVGIGYGDDIETAKQVIRDAVKSSRSLERPCS